MKNFIKICVLFLLIIQVISASQVDDLMKHGNEEYKNGNYQNAIVNYEKLVHEGYQGTSLFYNLANAYYKENQIGYAILNYERALKLSPKDDDIQHNLAIANAKTVDRINTLPEFFIFQIWESVLSFFPISGWTYFTYFLFILILLSAGIFFFTKNSLMQRYSFLGGLVILVLFILSTVILSININRELNVKNGIIVAQTVSAKLSPDTKSNDAFVIHEGLKVRMEDKVDNWVKIRLNDGKVGWLPQDDVGQI